MHANMNTDLKKFINEFNFPEPDWSNLPKGFPSCNLTGLSVQEKHLFGAIKTIWFITKTESLSLNLPKVMNVTLAMGVFGVFVFGIASLAYFVNVEYNLGFTFLTDLFA